MPTIIIFLTREHFMPLLPFLSASFDYHPIPFITGSAVNPSDELRSFVTILVFQPVSDRNQAESITLITIFTGIITGSLLFILTVPCPLKLVFFSFFQMFFYLFLIEFDSQTGSRVEDVIPILNHGSVFDKVFPPGDFYRMVLKGHKIRHR